MRLFAQYKDPLARTKSECKVFEIIETSIGTENRYVQGFVKKQNKEHFLCASCDEEGHWLNTKLICGEDLECLNFPDLIFGEKYTMQIDKDSRKVVLLRIAKSETTKEQSFKHIVLADKLLLNKKYHSLFSFSENTFQSECDKLIEILGIPADKIFRI